MVKSVILDEFKTNLLKKDSNRFQIVVGAPSKEGCNKRDRVGKFLREIFRVKMLFKILLLRRGGSDYFWGSKNNLGLF